MNGDARSASATRRAAAWANSLGLPTTKFSKVKRGSSGAPISSRSLAAPARRRVAPRRRARRRRRAAPRGWRGPRRGRGSTIRRDAAGPPDSPAPQRPHAVGVMGGDPVAQEARRHGDHALAAVDPLTPSSSGARSGRRSRRLPCASGPGREPTAAQAQVPLGRSDASRAGLLPSVSYPCRRTLPWALRRIGIFNGIWTVMILSDRR